MRCSGLTPQILATLSNLGINQTESTKRQLVRLYKMTGDPEAAMAVVDQESDADVSTMLLTAGIEAAPDAATGLRMLDRAMRLGKADRIMFMTLAKLFFSMVSLSFPAVTIIAHCD